MTKSITFIITIILAASLMSCSSDALKERRINFNFDNAEYLLIYKAELEDAVKITDEDVLQDYADEFNSHKYVKTGNTSEGDYCYRFEWYDANNKNIESIFITEENGYKIRYNGSNYKVGADHNVNEALYQDLFD